MLKGMFSWSLEKSGVWGRAELHLSSLYVTLITAEPGSSAAGEATLWSYTASDWGKHEAGSIKMQEQ